MVLRQSITLKIGRNFVISRLNGFMISYNILLESIQLELKFKKPEIKN